MTVQKRTLITTVLTFILFTSPFLLQQANADGKEKFEDVNRFEKEIYYLRDLNIIHGFTDTQFKPHNSIKRVDAVRMLMRQLNIDLNDVINPEFTDVPETHPAYKQIAKAKELRIIDGIGNGLFDPNGKLTRAQMAKIMASAYSLTGTYEKGFTDLSSSYWAAKYINALASNNITVGYSDGSFKPTKLITRQEFSAFLARHLNNYFKRDQKQPTFTAETINNTTLRITFDEPVSNMDSPNVKIGVGYFNEINYFKDIKKINDRTYDLIFPYYFFSAGNVLQLRYNKISDVLIKSSNGNVLKEGTWSFYHPKDTKLPSVTDVQVISETSIEVTFSEQVVRKFAEREMYYDFYMQTEPYSRLLILDAKLDKSLTKVILTTHSLDAKTELRLTIRNISDYSQEQNKMNTQVITFENKDEKAPKFVDFDPSTEAIDAQLQTDTSVNLSFTENITHHTLLDKSNYSVKDKNGNVIASEQLELIPVYEGKALTINSNNVGNSLAGGTIAIQNLSDISGNTIVPITVQIPTIIGKAKLLKAEITDKVIKLYFNQYLSQVGSAEFVWASGDNPYDRVIGIGRYHENGKSIISISRPYYIDEQHIADGEVKLQTVVNGFNDAQQQAEAPVTQTVFGHNVDLKPTVLQDSSSLKLVETRNDIAFLQPISTVDLDADGKIDHIKVAFQEKVDPKSIDKSLFEVEGYTVIGAFSGEYAPQDVETSTDENQKLVYVQLKEKDTRDAYVKPRVSIKAGLTDYYGNTFNGESYITAVDRTVPHILSVKGNVKENTITIMFTEDIFGNWSMEKLLLFDFQLSNPNRRMDRIEYIDGEYYTANISGVIIHLDDNSMAALRQSDIGNLQVEVKPEAAYDSGGNYVQPKPYIVR